MSERISPTLKRALEKLEKIEINVNDLPADTEARQEDWGVIKDQANLQPLELVALKSHKQLQQQLLLLRIQQQQQQEDDNILGPGVYDKLTRAVCFFRDSNNDKPIGTGFAVSPTTVYSVAHNFEEPAIGTEITCHFGKPNNQIVRRLLISDFDSRLDYCVLNTAPGEATLPDFLPVSTAPLQTGKNCILAAFQIGIQQDLKDLDPDLSVGVFKGEIAKLYPHHFVYQCPSFAGDSGGAVVLKDGNVIGIHQETVIQARERMQHGQDTDADVCLDSVEASVDELIRTLSSGCIGLQLSAVPNCNNIIISRKSGGGG